ncbi:MAG: Unknown protein [uncultured Thiotrichaceae bacterium]|uniref:Toxin CcdB n=1 Tax=uncultured Thiotrichaceae bacterium TaxID=298394 RepID=A0A6S6TCM9_9GAMM|nr:MAG: Unknown protein [uncultured Thiotrichaceae bacterium]
MAQFDVYRNNNPASQEHIPYLLDVQSDLLDVLNTRVIVPLNEDTLTTPRIGDTQAIGIT